MKVGVLFSGGKDSNYAAYLARRKGHEISCLISLASENEGSYMFHTPAIEKVSLQAEVMGIPLIVFKTLGEKEKELLDLEKAIKKAVLDFGVEGIVTGAVNSVYQATRIQKICHKLGLVCFNPLWQKDEIEILRDLIGNGFEVILTGVFAYPLDKSYLGRKIDSKFIEEFSKLKALYGISPAGEGGEFESFVLNSPMFKTRLKVLDFEDSGSGNSWRREVVLE